MKIIRLGIIISFLLASSFLMPMESVSDALIALKDHLNYLATSIQSPLVPTQKQQQTNERQKIPTKPYQSSVQPGIAGKVARRDFPLYVGDTKFKSLNTIKTAIGIPVSMLQSHNDIDPEIMGIIGRAQRLGVWLDDYIDSKRTKNLFLIFLTKQINQDEVDEAIQKANNHNIHLFVLESNIIPQGTFIRDTDYNKNTLQRLGEVIRSFF